MDDVHTTQLKYVLSVVDRGSRALLGDQKKIVAGAKQMARESDMAARATTTAGRRSEQAYGGVARAATRAGGEVRRAQAQQTRAWQDAERAAVSADRKVSQAVNSIHSTVSRQTANTVRDLRRQGQSYEAILGHLRSYRVSATEAGNAVERQAQREERALNRLSGAYARLRGQASTAGRAGAGAAARDARGAERGAVAGALGRGRGIGVGGLALGGAGALAGYFSVEGMRHAIDSTKELVIQEQLLQKVGGLNNRNASQWAAIAQTHGIASRSMYMSFRTLDQAMAGVSQAQYKVTAGAKGANDAMTKSLQPFRSVGITAKDVAAHQGDLSGMMKIVIDRLGKAGDKHHSLVAAQKLLGRGAQALSPLLMDGAKGLEEQAKWAEKYGVVLHGNTTQKIKELHDRQIEMQYAMLGFQIQFTTKVAPMLMKLALLFINVANTLRQDLGPGIHMVTQFFHEHAAAARIAADALGALLAAYVGLRVITRINLGVKAIQELGAVGVQAARRLATSWGLVRTEATAATVAQERAGAAGAMTSGSPLMGGAGGGAAATGRFARLRGVGRAALPFALLGGAVAAGGPGSPVGNLASGAAAGSMFGPYGALVGGAGGLILPDAIARYQAGSRRGGVLGGIGGALTSKYTPLGQISQGIGQIGRGGIGNIAGGLGRVALGSLPGGSLALGLLGGEKKTAEQRGKELAKSVAKGIPGATGDMRKGLEQLLSGATKSGKWTSAGKQIGDALSQGIRSGPKYTAERFMYGDFVNTFKKLPKAAREQGALSMLNLSRGMEQSGRLPKGATQKLIQDIEKTYPDMTKFIEQSGIDANKNLAKAFQRKDAIDSAQKLVDKAGNHFRDLKDGAKLNAENTRSVLAAKIKWLQDNIPKMTGPMKDQAVSDLDALKKAAQRDGEATRSALQGAFKDLLVTVGPLVSMFRGLNDQLGGVPQKLATIAAQAGPLGPIMSGLQSAIAQASAPKKFVVARTPGMAGGGRVPGQRAPADNVLAALSPEEFVVTGDGEGRLEDMTFPGVLDWLEGVQRPHFRQGGRATATRPEALRFAKGGRYPRPKKMGASWFSDPGGGASGQLSSHPWSYAELSWNPYDWKAMGMQSETGDKSELPFGYRISASRGSKSVVIGKYDRGLGGGPAGGLKRAVDLYIEPAKYLGISSDGLGVLTIQDTSAKEGTKGAAAIPKMQTPGARTPVTPRGRGAGATATTISFDVPTGKEAWAGGFGLGKTGSRLQDIITESSASIAGPTPTASGAAGGGKKKGATAPASTVAARLANFTATRADLKAISGLVNVGWSGGPLAAWIAYLYRYAKKKGGWDGAPGQVSLSGYRTRADQARVTVMGNLTSHHMGRKWPSGAIDIGNEGDLDSFNRIIQRSPYKGMLWKSGLAMGPASEYEHMSSGIFADGTSYRQGGRKRRPGRGVVKRGAESYRTWAQKQWERIRPHFGTTRASNPMSLRIGDGSGLTTGASTGSRGRRSGYYNWLPDEPELSRHGYTHETSHNWQIDRIYAGGLAEGGAEAFAAAIDRQIGNRMNAGAQPGGDYVQRGQAFASSKGQDFVLWGQFGVKKPKGGTAPGKRKGSPAAGAAAGAVTQGALKGYADWVQRAGAGGYGVLDVLEADLEAGRSRGPMRGVTKLQALDLVHAEIARRMGLALKGVEDMQRTLDRQHNQFDRDLRKAGIEPTSSVGLAAQGVLLQQTLGEQQAALSPLALAYARAQGQLPGATAPGLVPRPGTPAKAKPGKPRKPARKTEGVNPWNGKIEWHTAAQWRDIRARYQVWKRAHPKPKRGRTGRGGRGRKPKGPSGVAPTYREGGRVAFNLSQIGKLPHPTGTLRGAGHGLSIAGGGAGGLGGAGGAGGAMGQLGEPGAHGTIGHPGQILSVLGRAGQHGGHGGIGGSLWDYVDHGHALPAVHAFKAGGRTKPKRAKPVTKPKKGKGAASTPVRKPSSVPEDIQAELKQALQDLQDSIDETVTQIIENKRNQALQLAQDMVDFSDYVETGAQHDERMLELQQQLAGTFDTGGAARGANITGKILPAIQAQITALQGQQAVAQAQGNQALARQIAEAIWGKQEEMAQAQLDAQQAVAANTSNLKDFTGSLVEEFQGNIFSDVASIQNGA